MSQLIALIIAIALGAIVTAIGYVFMGDAFTNQSVKAEAQKILVQAEQIEAAMIAYKVDHGGIIKLGESDPNGDGDYSDSKIFDFLVGEGYLKENINSTLDDLTLSWHLDGDVIQRIVSEPDHCLEANHQRNGFPEEGLVGGESLSGGRTANVSEITNGVPECGTNTAIGAACCIEP